MRTPSAILGSAVFFLAAPCIVAGLLPYLVSRLGWWPFEPHPAVWWAALVLGCAAAANLVVSFARFALDGRGTPAPVAPTERLVVEGPYRHVRNPMYVAVIAIIGASTVIHGEGAVLAYGCLAAASMAMFVRLYEEPTLAMRYGQAYERYRHAVPGWIPRLRPWRGG